MLGMQELAVLIRYQISHSSVMPLRSVDQLCRAYAVIKEQPCLRQWIFSRCDRFHLRLRFAGEIRVLVP